MTSRTLPPAAVSKKPGVLPFAIAITVLNLLGHLWLGFEQPWATPFVAVGTAYACELAIEVAIRGWHGARFRGSWRHLLHFLLPAHISALAVGMLLFAGENFAVTAFAAAVAIFSKVLLRVAVPGAAAGTTVHYMNPSNLGIAISLVIFNKYVGVAPPYQFTENVSGALDWILPGLIVCSGSFLNYRATKRIPLILAWLGGFVLQAAVRSWISPQQFIPMLMPMTGLAFVLFTFYMVTDPMTTPRYWKAQIAFGASTAALYGVLTHAGIVFGLFFALCAVCAIRGTALAWLARQQAATSSHASTLSQVTQNA